MRRLTEIEAEVPSGTLGPTEVQIVDYGEMDIRRPDGKPIVRRSVPPQHRRSLVVAAAIALSLVAAWAFFQPRTPTTKALSSRPPVAAASASASASASVSLSPSAETPTTAVPPTVSPSESPPPVPEGGWVVKAEAGTKVGLGPVGPDGTVYGYGMAPIDEFGVSRPEWLSLPDGSHLVPQAFGPDGSAFGITLNTDGTGTIWAFGPDHLLRYMMQIPTYGSLEIVPRPDLGLDVLLGTYDAAGNAKLRVLAIDASGSLNADWPLGDKTTEASLFLVRDDGAILTAYRSAHGCAIHVFDPQGQEIGKPVTPCWDSISRAPDGRLVGESYVLSSQGAVTQTRIALLDQDGASLPGWARSIRGTASPPSFGVDGGLYFSYFALDGSKWLTALETNGETRSGFPTNVEPPDSLVEQAYPPPPAPLLGDGDVMYDFSPNGVTACDRAGQALPLSRDPVDDPVASIFYVRSPGRPGVLAVVAGRSVSLFNADGSKSREFSDPSSDFGGWLNWAVTRDGLVGLEMRSGYDGTMQMLIVFVPANLD